MADAVLFPSFVLIVVEKKKKHRSKHIYLRMHAYRSCVRLLRKWVSFISLQANGQMNCTKDIYPLRFFSFSLSFIFDVKCCNRLTRIMNDKRITIFQRKKWAWSFHLFFSRCGREIVRKKIAVKQRFDGIKIILRMWMRNIRML